jgi:hypothetical protein
MDITLSFLFVICQKFFLFRISFFYQMAMIRLYYQEKYFDYSWKYNELHPITWGVVATQFYHRLCLLSSPNHNATELSGCQIMGVYDKQINYIYRMEEIISIPVLPTSFHSHFKDESVVSIKGTRDPISLGGPNRNVAGCYYLLLVGPIHHFLINYSPLFYDLVLPFLIGSSSTNYKHMNPFKSLFPLICSSKLLKRYITSNNLWNRITYPSICEEMILLPPENPAKKNNTFRTLNFKIPKQEDKEEDGIHFLMSWDGVNNLGSEEEYWSDYQEEYDMTRCTVYK